MQRLCTQPVTDSVRREMVYIDLSLDPGFPGEQGSHCSRSDQHHGHAASDDDAKGGFARQTHNTCPALLLNVVYCCWSSGVVIIMSSCVFIMCSTKHGKGIPWFGTSSSRLVQSC